MPIVELVLHLASADSSATYIKTLVAEKLINPKSIKYAHTYTEIGSSHVFSKPHGFSVLQVTR